MAAAALISSTETNNPIHPNDIAEALGTIEKFKTFHPSLPIGLFSRYIEQIGADLKRGTALALRVVSSAVANSEDARFVIRTGLALGRRGCGLTSPEIARIKELCAALGVAPSHVWGTDFVNLDFGDSQPLIITIGNEKGGTGKSTIAMHMVVAMLKLGYTVGSIDLDGRQGTLSRYLANRRAFKGASDQPIEMPLHRRIQSSQDNHRASQGNHRAFQGNHRAGAEEEWERFRDSLIDVSACQVVVIDTPGNDSYLSRLAHANAHMVITPLNDTFLDLDVLAEIDCARREIQAPSVYCKMIMERNDDRLLCDRKPIHWIVMRNRLTHVDSRNKREIIGLLNGLSERLGFQLVTGFGERVIFHELFLSGLVLLDLPDESARDRNYMSHSRACQEFRTLLLEIGAMV